MIEVFILSLIQGITEFIPVSSSAHLFLVSEFINFDDQSLSIDVSLHIGSFIAVVSYFQKDLISFIKNIDLFVKILISSIPLMIVGFILIETNLIEKIRNLKVISWTTLIFGFLLYYSDKFKLNNNLKENFSIKSALFIGIFQILSLVPGVSRSGITISAARILKFNRYDSAKISFLLSIPTLAAVSIFGLQNMIVEENISFTTINFLAIFFSFLISFITIKYFLNFVKNFSLKIFVFYRIALGLVLLSIAYL